jgi:hypothetical protein
MAKIKIAFVLLFLSCSIAGNAQTANDLLGKWKFYFSMPDGKVLSDKTLGYFVNFFVQNTKEEKLKQGEAFTAEDSVKAYKEFYDPFYVLLTSEFIFKVNNACHAKAFMDGKMEEKNIKYKYHADTKIVDVIGEDGDNSPMTLKKEENTVHLYMNSEDMAALNQMGWKAYFKKAK